MLAVAAVLHGGLFFFFSIIYPRQQSGAIDQATVYYVVAGSPESMHLSALLDSSDSAVFAPGRGLPLTDVVAAGSYTPQYETARLVLAPIPSPSASAPPAPSGSGPVPVFRRAVAGQPSGQEIPSARWSATGALGSRIPSLPPDAGLHPPLGSSPGSAVFLAAVRGDGSVAHVFSQQSSGDEMLDRQSAGILRKSHFSQGPDRQEWGLVTFQWGLPSPP
jgi:hypothetical protein